MRLKEEQPTVEQTVESALDNIPFLESNVELGESRTTELKEHYPDPLYTFFGLFMAPMNSLTPTSFQTSQNSIYKPKRKEPRQIPKSISGNTDLPAYIPTPVLNRPIAAHSHYRPKKRDEEGEDQ